MSSAKKYTLNRNKYLMDSEVERLETILDSFAGKDPRNCLLIKLALHTGARAQELLNLTGEDLHDHDESVLIKGLKGSNDRELPLRRELFKTLRAQLPPRGLIFPISYHRLYQIWHQYRPVPKKFHSLRHTFAIRLYRKTKDLRLVQVALGHRNITNTMIYADYLYSQQELRKLIL
jgi:integrase/recombinase XerC